MAACKWISIEKRLPKKQVVVITLCEDGTVQRDWIVDDQARRSNGSFARWEAWGQGGPGVTHWIPWPTGGSEGEE